MEGAHASFPENKDKEHELDSHLFFLIDTWELLPYNPR